MIAKLFRRSTFSPQADLSETARLVAAPHVSCASTQGDTVLLDRRGGAYYVLNESGAVIWDMLRQGATLAEIVDALADRYDAPRERLYEDATALTSGMLRASLIRRQRDAGAP